VSLSELFGRALSALFGILVKYGRVGRTAGRGPEVGAGAISVAATALGAEPVVTVRSSGCGHPYRTAHRWLAHYRRFGLVALARKKRDDCGARRAVSVKVKEAIEGLALQKPPLPVAALYRQVRRVVQDLGEPTPSYSVVYDIVHTLPADLVTLAHDGTKAYSNTFELVHRAKPTAPILSRSREYCQIVSASRAPASPWHAERERIFL
jgi:hypothetical protein